MSTATTQDIAIAEDGPFGTMGSWKMNVAASATLIYPGDPVTWALGGAAVTPMATNKPVVATDFLAGIAVSKSTNTAGAAGTVQVVPLMPGQTYLIKPNNTALWDTQAEYDALVGDRVLIDLTSSVYTLLATDGATYGCVVLPMTITDNPGKVKFAFRNGVSSLT